jgi:hypothetical protein
MVKMQGGVFGAVAGSAALIGALTALRPNSHQPGKATWQP